MITELKHSFSVECSVRVKRIRSWKKVRLIPLMRDLRFNLYCFPFDCKHLFFQMFQVKGKVRGVKRIRSWMKEDSLAHLLVRLCPNGLPITLYRGRDQRPPAEQQASNRLSLSLALSNRRESVRETRRDHRVIGLEKVSSNERDHRH